MVASSDGLTLPTYPALGTDHTIVDTVLMAPRPAKQALLADRAIVEQGAFHELKCAPAITHSLHQVWAGPQLLPLTSHPRAAP